jgi:hypothetical protein
MCDFVSCRLDIGYAMAELSKFSCGPAACHFAAAKRVFQYLRQTKDEGLVYWRPKPILDLPHVPLKCRTVDEVDLKLPYSAGIYINWLITSTHHTRIVPRLADRWGLRSEAFCLAGAAIYYRAKWIIMICTSSTEAEFVVCVTAGK